MTHLLPDRHLTPGEIEDVLQQLADQLTPAGLEIAVRLAMMQERYVPAARRGGPIPLLGHVPAAEAPPQHVTLDQIAAIVHRKKRGLDVIKKTMPPPAIRGHRGQPHLWRWEDVRPWLLREFPAYPIPVRFPYG